MSLRDFFDTAFFLIASYFAYRDSKIEGHKRTVFFLALFYVTVFDIVDIFYPIKLISLQVFWIVAVILVSIVVFPYLFRLVKRDIKNLLKKHR